MQETREAHVFRPPLSRGRERGLGGEGLSPGTENPLGSGVSLPSRLRPNPAKRLPRAKLGSLGILGSLARVDVRSAPASASARLLTT